LTTLNALGLEGTAVAQPRIEEVREAAGEGDDGPCFPRRAAMRKVQVRSASACGGRRRRINAHNAFIAPLTPVRRQPPSLGEWA